MRWSRVLSVVAAGVGAAVWAACGSEDVTSGGSEDVTGDGKGDPGKACFDPNSLPDPAVGEGEKIYKSDHHVVVADDQVKPVTAEFYLNELPAYADKVLNFFRIASPWREKIRLVLRDTNHPLACPVHTIGCAPRGIMTVHFATDAFPAVNDAARDGKIYAENVFAHEMSHFLRRDIASPWWGLEEGLAVFTERAMVPAPEPAGTAHKLFDEAVFEDNHRETPLLSDTLHSPYIQSLEVYLCPSGTDAQSISEGPTVRYFLRDDAPAPVRPDDLRTGIVKIPVDKPTELLDLVLFSAVADVTTSNFNTTCNLGIKIYQRSLGADLQPNDLRKTSECTNDGIVNTQVVNTDDGEPLLRKVGDPQPYVALDDYTRGKNSEATEFAYYDTGYCFWKTIERDYGGRTVNKILLSMANFSQQHQESPADFAFLKAVMEYTSMDETAARDFFRRFSAPTEDKWYPLGGVCWAQ